MTTSQLTLTLDDFTFQDFEIPEVICLGGSQMLKIHKLIGGKRVIDPMGPDEDPVEWSGRFRGSSALSRARTLDAKRKAGKAISLTFGEASLTVLIAHFRYDTRMGGLEVPYAIRLEVVEEQPLQSDPGLDEMTVGDQATTDAWAGQINDPTLNSTITGFDTTLNGIPSFANADQPTLLGALTSLNTVRAQITSMIETNEDSIVNLVPFGIARSNPAAQLAAVVMGQTTGLAENYRLYEMLNTTGRMAANLGAAAGLFQSAPAISGVFNPAQPNYGTSLLFSGGLQPQLSQGVNANQTGGTYDFPDWGNAFLSELDFTAGQVSNGSAGQTYTYPDWGGSFDSKLNFSVS